MMNQYEKAIKHFEHVRDGAIAVLDSGFGTYENESDIFYRNQKMCAELAIYALKKQIPEPFIRDYEGLKYCPHCWIEFTGDDEKYNLYCPNCGQMINFKGE